MTNSALKDTCCEDDKCCQAEDAGEKSHLTTYSPRIDLTESDEQFTLWADLPGVTAEDLDIRFEDGVLKIHGPVKSRQGDVDYLVQEYGVGDFHRQFTLGEAVDVQRITAQLDEGVLSVGLPKRDAVKPRRIDVKTV
jgi:HSP20 family protein